MIDDNLFDKLRKSSSFITCLQALISLDKFCLQVDLWRSETYLQKFLAPSIFHFKLYLPHKVSFHPSHPTALRGKCLRSKLCPVFLERSSHNNIHRHTCHCIRSASSLCDGVTSISSVVYLDQTLFTKNIFAIMNRWSIASPPYPFQLHYKQWLWLSWEGALGSWALAPLVAAPEAGLPLPWEASMVEVLWRAVSQ